MTPMPISEEHFYQLGIDDIITWADDIAGEWNGDNPGSQEERANQAESIIEKASELKKLIAGMAEL